MRCHFQLAPPPGTLPLREAKAANTTCSLKAPHPSLIFLFWGLRHAVCRILVLQPEITPMTLHQECSLNHWATRAVPPLIF